MEVKSIWRAKSKSTNLYIKYYWEQFCLIHFESVFTHPKKDVIIWQKSYILSILYFFVFYQCVSEEEDVTREEVKEEQDFIDAMVDTKVMQMTMEFLASKSLIGMVISVIKFQARDTKLIRFVAQNEQLLRKISYLF